MYPRKEFDKREKEYGVLLRRKLEEAEAMLLKLNPSRERSLALTKLDETLLWANVAIAAAGISTDREGSAASEAAEQSWAMMSAPVMKKEVRAVSPGRTFLNNKKLQEAVDDALLNAKANGALKEAQVRAARIAEPAEHEFFRMEKWHLNRISGRWQTLSDTGSKQMLRSEKIPTCAMTSKPLSVRQSERGSISLSLSLRWSRRRKRYQNEFDPDKREKAAGHRRGVRGL